MSLSQTLLAHASLQPHERLIRNLRDLRLDEEVDWPEIDSTTFIGTGSVVEQKNRVRKAEWVLYHLLARYEPEHTKKAFKDLYPAFEPRQSITLRNALFERFRTLQTHGIFAKDVSLSRSMLNDCKDIKFEQFLGVFSTVVALKSLKQDKRDHSIARKVILGDRNPEVNTTLTLMGAYNASLRNLLQQQKQLTGRWQTLQKSLKWQAAELEQRRVELSKAKAAQSQKHIPKRTIEKLQEHVAAQWQDSEAMLRVLLDGDQGRPTGRLLEREFAQVWKAASADDLYSLRPHANPSILGDLEARVAAQPARLQKWKGIRDALIAEDPDDEPERPSSEGMETPEAADTGDGRADDSLAAEEAEEYVEEESSWSAYESPIKHIRNDTADLFLAAANADQQSEEASQLSPLAAKETSSAEEPDLSHLTLTQRTLLTMSQNTSVRKTHSRTQSAPKQSILPSAVFEPPSTTQTPSNRPYTKRPPLSPTRSPRMETPIRSPKKQDVEESPYFQEAFARQEDDYDAVFKSRPKIANSPVFDPMKEPVLESVDEEMNLNE